MAYAVKQAESITANKKFSDRRLTWKFVENDAHGKSRKN